ncbi:GNAT family N-acetyltransferase [Luedemannella flava]
MAALLTASWGGTAVAAHGRLYDAATLPALVAVRDGQLCGVLTYHLDADGLEVVTLDAVPAGQGNGTALRAARDVAVDLGCARAWLVTTNDNVDALRFYQRRGLRISAVAPGAVAAARALKPTIPEIGAYGIPIRDEITLETRVG